MLISDIFRVLVGPLSSHRHAAVLSPAGDLPPNFHPASIRACAVLSARILDRPAGGLSGLGHDGCAGAMPPIQSSSARPITRSGRGHRCTGHGAHGGAAGRNTGRWSQLPQSYHRRSQETTRNGSPSSADGSSRDRKAARTCMREQLCCEPTFRRRAEGVYPQTSFGE
jgi:hypothetical protein